MDVVADLQKVALMAGEAAVLAKSLRGRRFGWLLAYPSLDGTGEMCEATIDFVRLGRDEEVYSVMLMAEFGVEAVLEATERCLLVARDGDRGSLVASRVRLDLVLERVIVEVICDE